VLVSDARKALQHSCKEVHTHPFGFADFLSQILLMHSFNAKRRKPSCFSSAQKSWCVLVCVTVCVRLHMRACLRNVPQARRKAEAALVRLFHVGAHIQREEASIVTESAKVEQAEQDLLVGSLSCVSSHCDC
jgi:hypothetical protein